MFDILNEIKEFFTPDRLYTLLKLLSFTLVGFLFIKLISFIVGKTIEKRMSRQSKMLVRKGILYIGWVIILFVDFSILGLKITSLLAAVGAVGIVVGIASQTSIGNIISGVFLVSERPFEIGDVIKVGNFSGIVHSIDLLSIKIRTFDNTLIRVPNQQIISVEVTNVTKFPIRRLDFELRFKLDEDLDKIDAILKEVVKNNGNCLNEPEPLIVYKEFGPSSINVLLGVWFEKTKYLAVKNGVLLDLKKKFEQEGIEVPYPWTAVQMHDMNILTKK